LLKVLKTKQPQQKTEFYWDEKKGGGEEQVETHGSSFTGIK
jgi:hypothetical protein